MWLRFVSTLVLAGLMALGAGEARASAPNVILLVADDLGWRDVGFHQGEVETPHLDGLAAGGVVLDRFYVQPICSPTRASVMTGKSSARLGLYRPLSKLDQKGIPMEEEILPAFFSAAGYQTFMVGKWHLGHAEKRFFPHARGFDHFYGNLTGGIGYWDHNHGGGHDWQRNGTTLREEGYATHLTADEAVRLLRQRDRTRPVFLYVAFNAPHLPNEAPGDSIEAYAETMRTERRIHAAMVSELDAAIGRILETLHAEGMREDTLVWFFSDNGGLNRSSSPATVVRLVDALVALFGEPLPIGVLEFVRENVNAGGSDNAPFRGGKGLVYEGGIRVPSLVSWPGRLAPGRSDAFVTAQDVLPTMLTAVGLEDRVPSDLDGASRWRALQSDEVSPFGDEPPRDFRVQGYSDVALVRPPWKLVVPGSLLPWGAAPELYRIDQDPTESTDLATQHPEKVAELTAALDAWPLGPSIHASVLSVVLDPDRFGGPEDREPWADVAR